MSDLQSDDSLRLPLKEILEAFECSICMCQYTDPVMTLCGHSFCKNCILECINRKHECPECKHALEKESMQRNYKLETILHVLKEKKEKEMSKIIKQVAQNLKMDNDEINPLTEVFKSQIGSALILYDGYYRDLLKEVENITNKIKSKYALIKVSKQGSIEELKLIDEEMNKELASVSNKFQKSLDYIMESYAHYIKTSIPPPSLVPIQVKIRIVSKNITIEPYLLKPFETLKEIKDVMIKHFHDRADPIKKMLVISAAVQGPLYVEGNENNGILNGRTEVKDDCTPLFKCGACANCIIMVIGDIKLESDTPKPCMSLTFVKGDTTTCNYYSCDECKLNWICEHCMKVCHKGHTVKEYLMHHVPTWACCYCSKNDCKLPNKNNPLAKMDG